MRICLILTESMSLQHGADALLSPGVLHDACRSGNRQPHITYTLYSRLHMCCSRTGVPTGFAHRLYKRVHALSGWPSPTSVLVCLWCVWWGIPGQGVFFREVSRSLGQRSTHFKIYFMGSLRSPPGFEHVPGNQKFSRIPGARGTGPKC